MVGGRHGRVLLRHDRATTERGLGGAAHAPLALQASRGRDGERADRAERRRSMEITSDQ